MVQTLKVCAMSDPTTYEEKSEPVQVSRKQIVSLIKDININKPSGIANISGKVLKDVLTCLPDQVLHLFRTSFKKNVFPTEWGKPGDQTLATNLRHISILPCIGKMIEKVAHTYLADYLEEQNFLVDCQYRYRKNLSTDEAVFDLVNNLFKYRDMRQGTVCGWENPCHINVGRKDER